VLARLAAQDSARRRWWWKWESLWRWRQKQGRARAGTRTAVGVTIISGAASRRLATFAGLFTATISDRYPLRLKPVMVVRGGADKAHYLTDVALCLASFAVQTDRKWLRKI